MKLMGSKQLFLLSPRHLVKECFAVDYNSTDGTVEYFKQQKIPVIQQAKKGRGAAFTIGIEKAKGKYIVFFSPDGNENPKDIPKLIDLLERGNALAIASRFMKGARNEEDDQVLKFRKWANQFFTITANIFWHGQVTDSINGYRAIRKDVFTQLRLNAEGFAIEYQMTIRILKKGLKIGEIPTYEGNRIGGFSTSYAIPTGIEFIKFLLREILVGNNF